VSGLWWQRAAQAHKVLLLAVPGKGSDRTLIKEKRRSAMLMRIFARVDNEGKIIIPPNFQKETGLKKGQLVELRVVGASKKKSLVISARDNAR
jgi:hypothetical protein